MVRPNERTSGGTLAVLFNETAAEEGAHVIAQRLNEDDTTAERATATTGQVGGKAERRLGDNTVST
jgi:hypothetical protein